MNYDIMEVIFRMNPLYNIRRRSRTLFAFLCSLWLKAPALLNSYLPEAEATSNQYPTVRTSIQCDWTLILDNVDFHTCTLPHLRTSTMLRLVTDTRPL